MLDMLKWLWDVVAGPILDKLGFHETPATGEWPHVCWIPTGSCIDMPIHAAGYHYETGSQTVLDRVVSSYSTSIKALLYASRNKSQSRQGQALERTVLVSMGATPECTQLPFAKKEITELNSLLPTSIPRIALYEPLKDDTLAALRDCSGFRFAGHVVSHPTDPSMSNLLLTDWQTNPLTVKKFGCYEVAPKPSSSRIPLRLFDRRH